ncbi:NUDIX hydrolase [Candidatus Woesearchaeota archaeon]|nr:NUDIX hydrolase [Candidatus Woesearchaeota archaeon]
MVQTPLTLSGCLIINDKQELLLLFRKDHRHYETPGGKVKKEECRDLSNPSRDELMRAALRELSEEMGTGMHVESIKYFGSVIAKTPDRRPIRAHKFILKIAGTPKIMEPETFSHMKYLPIANLAKFQISPDLKLLVPKLKKYAERHQHL